MMQRPDRTNVLKTSTVPVLFIMGEDDNAIPIKDVLEQCHLPGKSYIHVLNYSGHMGMLEEADKSNKALAQFLSEI
jgi:pimeloyl-ACP methyl ester carboxylesterase